MQICISKKEMIIFGIIFLALLVVCIWPTDARCGRISRKEVRRCLDQIAEIKRRSAFRREALNGTEEGRRAAWIVAKAEFAELRARQVAQKDKKNSENAARQIIADCVMLLRLESQCCQGASELSEEPGSKLRAYKSEIDGTYQTYSVSVPAAYDPAVKWPLIVSMHGHGWYAPFQGHPAPAFGGAFCLSPQGRGATDYKDLGELDVLAAIAEVKRDFQIDENRVYLTGGSMGGTGSLHIGVHYADQFAAIFPIVPNSDNLAWTARWGWNRLFPGRFDEMRLWIQEGHTARAFAQNLLNLPVYLLAGGADTVCPTEHARNTVAELRRLGCKIEYREFPNCGHGGFPASASEDGMSWMCGWVRNPYPRHVSWKTALLKHGKAYWIRMEQLERALEFGEIDAVAGEGNRVECTTSNLQAFSIYCAPELFTQGKPIFLTIDKQLVILPPTVSGSWVTLRKDIIHGWDQERYRMVPEMKKQANLEGPIQEAFMAPFVLVVGTQSAAPEKNKAWLEEARYFAREWKRRNLQACRIVLDKDCTMDILEKYNIVLLGDARDNSISALLGEPDAIHDALLPLLISGIDMEREDIGMMSVYPTGDYGTGRLTVRVSANSPGAVWQLWGRFGNWFNWGVYDSKKYFDYCVFDAKSCSPETMLLLGWFGTDWQAENGKYFMANKALRSESARQCYPKYSTTAVTPEKLPLVELMPSEMEQMRGAFGWGRSFNGEICLANDLSQVDNVIGVRAPATLTFKLGKRYNEFSSEVRIHNPREVSLCQPRQQGESVAFAVYGDGKLLANAAVTWKNEKAEIRADVTGVDELRLETVPAGGPSWLHAGALWLNPVMKASGKKR